MAAMRSGIGGREGSPPGMADAGELVRVDRADRPPTPIMSRAAWPAAHVTAAAILAWIAILNGFPLVFADSGSYLRIGTEFYYPVDRPVTYGLLILPLYAVRLWAGLGLWAVIGAQAIGATILIRMTMRAAGGADLPGMLVALCAALGLFSSLPWFVGQVMPDVMTGFVPLVVFLILYGSQTRRARWLMPIVLAGLCACHLSHIPLAAILTLVAVPLGAATLGIRRAAMAGLRAAAGILLAVVGLSSMNLVVEHRFAPSLASDRFMAARLFDAGIAQPVLRDLCRSRPLGLCAARPLVDDPAVALPGQAYLWGGDRSPLPSLMHRDPDRLAREEKLLVRQTLVRSPGAVLRMAATSWATQLYTARPGDGIIPYAPDMAIVTQIARHFPGAAPAFAASLQQRGMLRAVADAAAIVEYLAGFVALAFTAVVLAIVRPRDRRILGLAAMIVTAIVANAAITGILSGPFDRYESRVSWLAVFLGIVVLRHGAARRSARAVPA